jgi:hypothetical protein
MTAAPGNSRSRWTLTDWEHRLRGEPEPPLPQFTDAEMEGLQPPVRRHLTHAIAAGTPLSPCARLSMRGTIKLGRWLPFRARQVLHPHKGFIWTARVAGVIAGSDQYLHGTGGMDWKLAGLLRVAHAEGPDVSRSTAGRGGAEAIWLPTAMLPRHGVRWTAHDDTHITAHHQLDETPLDVHHTLGPDGSIQSLVFDRWGDPDKAGRWDWHPFGGEITAQHTFAGLTIPSSGRMGWHYGTDRWPAGEFFRFKITALRPLPPAGSRHVR